jgi:hypothetical protein
MIVSPTEQAHLVSHMSAQEPRIFPGVIHERTRRGSMRASAAAQDIGILGPALAKMALKEEAAAAQGEDESG